mgnify:CR=1 FL=1
MTVVELISKLPTKRYQSPIYFRIGRVSYPITLVEEEEISTEQTLVILSNERNMIKFKREKNEIKVS